MLRLSPLHAGEHKTTSPTRPTERVLNTWGGVWWSHLHTHATTRNPTAPRALTCSILLTSARTSHQHPHGPAATSQVHGWSVAHSSGPRGHMDHDTLKHVARGGHLFGRVPVLGPQRLRFHRLRAVRVPRGLRGRGQFLLHEPGLRPLSERDVFRCQLEVLSYHRVLLAAAAAARAAHRPAAAHPAARRSTCASYTLPFLRQQAPMDGPSSSTSGSGARKWGAGGRTPYVALSAVSSH